MTYAMMPMGLAWCFLCSLITSALDLAQTVILFVTTRTANNQSNEIGSWGADLARLVLSKLLIYLAINLVCLYTKYLIDLSQRNAFLEARRSIETRAKIERENSKQERLLLSLLPRFVAIEIIGDIAKEDNHDKLLKKQFHKIYIHSYSNVR